MVKVQTATKTVHQSNTTNTTSFIYYKLFVVIECIVIWNPEKPLPRHGIRLTINSDRFATIACLRDNILILTKKGYSVRHTTHCFPPKSMNTITGYFFSNLLENMILLVITPVIHLLITMCVQPAKNFFF